MSARAQQETRADRITLTLLEDTPSGPYWEVRVEGDKNFSLSSDELVLNLGHKRPAIKFTSEGMSTMCSKCGGEVRYGFRNKKPTWWCTECGHQRIASVQVLNKNKGIRARATKSMRYSNIG